jgi:hypothetical protein
MNETGENYQAVKVPDIHELSCISFLSYVSFVS